MRNLIARCVALAGLVVSVVLGPVPAGAQQATPFPVSILPILPVAPFYAAVQLSFFKSAGLDAQPMVIRQGGVAGIPGLVAGAYKVAYASTPSVLLAIGQGIDLRVVAGSGRSPAEPPEPAALVGRKADNLHSGKDLEGKRIAVVATQNVQWLFARAWVKATGGDPDKVQFREVPLPQMIDAVARNQVDAAVLIDPFLTFSKRNPKLAVIAWPFHDVMPGGQLAVFVVTGETADKHPDLVTKFVHGMEKGAAWVKANMGKEPYLKLVSGYSHLKPGLIAAMPPISTDVDVDMPSLKRMVELMRENGQLKTNIDVASKVFVVH